MSVSFSEGACAHVSGLPAKNPRDPGEKNWDYVGQLRPSSERGNLRWGEETRRCMSGAVCGALFSVRKYVIITIIILLEMPTHWEREIFAYRPILVKCS